MAEPAVLGVPDTPESVEAHRAFATTGILEGTKEPEPAPVDTSKAGEQTTNPTEPGDKSPAPPDPK